MWSRRKGFVRVHPAHTTGLCPLQPKASASAQSDRGGRPPIQGKTAWGGQLLITARTDEHPLCTWPVLYLWTPVQPWESPREEGVVLVLIFQVGKLRHTEPHS